MGTGKLEMYLVKFIFLLLLAYMSMLLIYKDEILLLPPRIKNSLSAIACNMFCHLSFRLFENKMPLSSIFTISSFFPSPFGASDDFDEWT